MELKATLITIYREVSDKLYIVHLYLITGSLESESCQ